MRIRKQLIKKSPEEDDQADAESEIYDGFKGGFRETEGGAQYWETVLMLRRLAISATILFTNAMVQLTLCLALSILFLVHHLSQKPFVYIVSNQAETLSLSMLFGIAAINLLKATVMYSTISVEGPQKEVLLDMELMEIMFVVILIGFIVCSEAGHMTAKKVKTSGVKQAWPPAFPFADVLGKKVRQLHAYLSKPTTDEEFPPAVVIEELEGHAPKQRASRAEAGKQNVASENEHPLFDLLSTQVEREFCPRAGHLGL